MKKALVVFFLFSLYSNAQDITDGGMDDDLNIGGDIFTDFSEELEDVQIQEDERFWRYGRFFSLYWGLGITSFGGNRGLLYKHDPPGFGFGIYYFKNFQSAYGLGIQYTQHHFLIESPVSAYAKDPLGYVEVEMLRSYFGYKYYIDTTNLSTAVTYSHPYFIGRMEYWYLTNKFQDQSALPDDTGGGLGFSFGFGLEFPIKLRESYVNLEFLMHAVNFHDKHTQDYAPVANNLNGYGYADLSGRTYSTYVNYVFSWGP